MPSRLIPSLYHLHKLLVLIFLLLVGLLPVEAQSYDSDINPDGFEPIAGKPGDIGIDDTSKTQGPTLFGVLENTHWDIASRFVTHYISKGLILDNDSTQTEIKLTFDNPFFDESFESHFFFNNFANFPLNTPLREIDYTFGLNFHLFDICDTLQIGAEFAYNYYTYPGPPQAAYQPVNRDNEFYGQLNAQWDKLTVLGWFYYELACIQSTTVIDITYETPLNDIHYCLPECFSLLATFESGYINVARPNGNQSVGQTSLLVDHYSYIQVGTYLKYKLNNCAQLQTGILYSANNGSSSNFDSQESSWTWNVIEFDVSY